MKNSISFSNTQETESKNLHDNLPDSPRPKLCLYGKVTSIKITASNDTETLFLVHTLYILNNIEMKNLYSDKLCKYVFSTKQFKFIQMVFRTIYFNLLLILAASPSCRLVSQHTMWHLINCNFTVTRIAGQWDGRDMRCHNNINFDGPRLSYCAAIWCTRNNLIC